MGDLVPPHFDIPASLDAQLQDLGPLLNASRNVHALGQSVIRRLHRDHHEQPFGSEYQKVAYLLFAKGLKTFDSATVLCRSGCGADALVLCASLFENLVNLRYIGMAADERSLQFMTYEQVEKYRQCEKLLRRSLPEDARQDWQLRREALFPQVESVLEHFAAKRYEKCGWCGETLRKRSIAVEMDLEYDTFYYIFCGFKHTLPGALSGFMLAHPDGVDAIVGPNIKGVFHAALHSTRYMLRLMDAFQSAFVLGIDAELGPATEALVDAAALVHEAHPDLCD